jgi:hypothetical protein
VAVTEAARHDLYAHLKETMGEQRAATLMALLPPVGWDDLATKQDLANLRLDLKAELEHTLRTHTLATIVANGVFVGIAVTLARLA